MLPISRPAVSRHLNVLKRASLVVEMPQRAILETLVMVVDRRSRGRLAPLAWTGRAGPSRVRCATRSRGGQVAGGPRRSPFESAAQSHPRHPLGDRAAPDLQGVGPGEVRLRERRPARDPLVVGQPDVRRAHGSVSAEIRSTVSDALRASSGIRSTFARAAAKSAAAKPGPGAPWTSTRVPGRSAPASRAAACSTATPNASNVSDCSRAVAVRTPRNGAEPAATIARSSSWGRIGGTVSGVIDPDMCTGAGADTATFRGATAGWARRHDLCGRWVLPRSGSFPGPVGGEHSRAAVRA